MSGGIAPSSTALGDALGAVPPHVAGDLAAARRVADEHHVAQVEVLEQAVQVVGVGVQVVAVPRLRGPAAAAAVVRHRAVAGSGDQVELRVPRRRR
jgi:hypothetical protein